MMVILLVLFQSIFGQVDRTRGDSSYSNVSWINSESFGGGNRYSWISSNSGITRNNLGVNSAWGSDGSNSFVSSASSSSIWDYSTGGGVDRNPVLNTGAATDSNPVVDTGMVTGSNLGGSPSLDNSNSESSTYSTGYFNNNWALEPFDNAWNSTIPTPVVRPLGSLRTNVSSIKELTSQNDPIYGEYLTNGQGYTLYADVQNLDTISCYNECEKSWPPAIITSDQTTLIGDNVNGNLLFEYTGNDGRLQLVYNHYPLYYYILDVQPGQKKGMGIDGRFYLISPSGNPIINN